MQERVTLTQAQINEELLRFPLKTPRWFWVAGFGLSIPVLAGLTAFTIMILFGLGVTGLNRPVFWGFLITNFVFWVGISHAGVMISSILRLSQAEWRRPVTRAAEVLTVFALSTSALYPVFHSGRPWRTIYWEFPYDFNRGIWSNVRSPLVWDPSAIFTYVSGAAMFVFVALLPDLANARDRTTGWRHTLYSTLSLGFRGTTRQWKLQTLAGILLSGLILPVFVSVHSIVSWDFAVSLVPTWHSTIFAPYFVIGAVWSGVAAVVTMMVILRRIFHLENYLTPDHFDCIGRLLFAVCNGWFYFYVLDVFFAMYGRDTEEVAVNELRIFQMPWAFLFFLFLITGYVVPVIGLMIKRVRRSIAAMFWGSLMVNLGMWLERYLIIVPGLVYKQSITFSWGEYTPSLIEALMVLFSFAFVSLGFLTFCKFFPIIPVFEQKEGQVFAEKIQVGRRTVPAVIREE